MSSTDTDTCRLRHGALSLIARPEAAIGSRVVAARLVRLLLFCIGDAGRVLEGDEAFNVLAGEDGRLFPLHECADVGRRGHGYSRRSKERGSLGPWVLRSCCSLVVDCEPSSHATDYTCHSWQTRVRFSMLPCGDVCNSLRDGGALRLESSLVMARECVASPLRNQHEYPPIDTPHSPRHSHPCR